jgi:hypothetical protein
MLARIDFDGDWIMADDWDATAALTANPQAYPDGVLDGDSGAQEPWIWWDPPMYQWLSLGPVMPAAYHSENATSGSFTYSFGRSSLKATLVNAPNR